MSTLPSWRKPKPRTWSPLKPLSPALKKSTAGHAEHADLLVQVAQVRDLDDLRLVLEARAAVGAEVAVRRRRACGSRRS